ncbi:SNF2-related protein [Actinokineospora auranticolor]|uniref:SNF2 helicase protein n=1 Tax=Actinokineospora auranticolor TaxID=155976 RepID=A0A2S6GC42_9PSEU|nr:DEAD/DEAH box helicase [Actinokineospora auranticolor]PPK61453.1 SNF2 helicase protein [Actinokineospora auranticolor]
MRTELARCAATVEAGTVAFHGDGLPDGSDLGELVLADRTVATVRLPLPEAVPILSRARREPGGHPTAAFWGAVVVIAIRCIARGALSAEDATRLGELAGRMPADAHNTDATSEAAVLAFVDAIVGPPPRQAMPGGVRLSLRLEPDGTCVPQAHAVFEPALVLDGAELWARGDDHGRERFVDAIVRASRRWPPLRRLVDQEVPDRLALTEAEVGDLLVNAHRMDIDVHWPRDLVGTVERRVLVGRTESRGLFSADWELTLDGAELTRAEVDALAATHRGAVRLRDRWVLVRPGLVPRALAPMGVSEALGSVLAGEYTVDGGPAAVAAAGALEALRARIADPEAGAEPVAQPAVLTATLRDYQLRGLRWLARMTGLGLGACLADDMGLGKTITVIALHLHRGPGPTLVVCPASLLGNWAREIARFAPGVPVHRFHGRDRTPAAAGFTLTTYPTMRRDAATLAAHPWSMVVADEAQHVKNASSATAKALRTIPADARIALTGTPVENSLADLWAILDWTTPGLLGSAAAFKARWAAPIESGRDPEAASRFSRLVRPFVLRRRKSDPGVAPELPPKTETDHTVPLTREQAGLYTAAVREAMATIRGAEGISRRGHVLKLLTALKQICNHPAQYLGEAEPRMTGRSGKLALLDDLLDTVVAEDGAALVFTQYVVMARLLEQHLTSRGIPVGLLHGGTPVPQRDRLVSRFDAGEFPVFLLSLKAAGTGLNLTRADHVVHYDRWWNPAVEDQATDRAHRIGQTKAVQVHRIMAEGTVEERVATLVAAKRELADTVLGHGEAALTELSDEALAELVRLR